MLWKEPEAEALLSLNHPKCGEAASVPIWLSGDVAEPSVQPARSVPFKLTAHAHTP
jgi:hypothetical protein